MVVPLRFPVLKGRLWGLFFGASPAQASEPTPAQPSPQPSSAQLTQPSPARPYTQPKPWCGPWQSCAKGFFFPDSDVAFSAAGTLRFWSVFGPFGAAVPLRFPVLSFLVPAQPGPVSLAQPTPAHSLAQPSSPQPSPAQPGPLRFPVWKSRLLEPAQPISAQPPSPALAKALPKPFSYRIQTPHGAAMPLRFPVLKPSLWGLVPSPAQPSQASTCQAKRGHSPSLGVGLAKALPKAFSYRVQRSRSQPLERSVFCPFGAAMPLRFPVLKGMGLGPRF